MDAISSPGESEVGPGRILAALVGSSDDYILELNALGIVTSWGGSAERLLGYRAGEMVGHDLAALVPFDRKEELPNALSRVRAGETVRYSLTARIRKDGTHLTVSEVLSPVVGPDDNLVGILLVGRDMTLHAETAEQLRKSERSATEALALLQTLQDSAPIGFGVLDHDFRVLRLNQMLGTFSGLQAHEQVGRLAGEVVPTLWPQIEPLFRQVRDTEEAIVGAELAAVNPSGLGGTHHWLTSYYPVRVDANVVGVGLVAVDITERKRVEEAHKKLTRSVVGALASALEFRDPYTDGHQDRVATIASAIAAEIGLDDSLVEGIEFAARIHDIGKIAIPAEILARPGQLNLPSWELIKLHASTGADIIRGVAFPSPVADMVEQHHERMDGSGYPNGIRGEEILLGSRIIAVADTVDAMTSHRPYRPAKVVDLALAELSESRGRQYDSNAVDACVSLFREKRLNLEW